MVALDPALGQFLRAGTVIPAHPLALTAAGQIDERHQRALTRYYCAAGVGGVAVGVHTTQFEIHEPSRGLLAPVLTLAAQTVDAYLREQPRPFLKIAGLVGRTEQAMREADLAMGLGYHAGLLSLSAFHNASDAELLSHCRQVAERIPVVGFYLQPAVGGRLLSYNFWRRFVEIENVVAIKVAPFSRYLTLDVVRALIEAGRVADVALYTGNDDNIVADLITDYSLDGSSVPARFVGGLLGQWAVWAKRAVEMVQTIQQQRTNDDLDYRHWLIYGSQLTDANAAIFDVAHNYQGCIPGIHRVLQQQGLLQGTWTLNPAEQLMPGQVAEIERVCARYPQLTDDEFVAAHLAEWLD